MPYIQIQTEVRNKKSTELYLEIPYKWKRSCQCACSRDCVCKNSDDGILLLYIDFAWCKMNTGITSSLQKSSKYFINFRAIICLNWTYFMWYLGYLLCCTYAAELLNIGKNFIIMWSIWIYLSNFILLYFFWI